MERAIVPPTESFMLRLFSPSISIGRFLSLMLVMSIGEGCSPKKTTDVQPRSPSADSVVSTAKAPVAPSTFRFDDRAKEMGIDFTYRNGQEDKLFSIVESLGGGVGMLDYDMDGKLDLFFPGGGNFRNDQSMPAHLNGLFRNQGKRFVEIALTARINHSHRYTHGVDSGDFDNDGFPDVVVSGYGQLELFHNQGDGTFERCNRWNDLPDPGWCSSVALGDFSGDGNLDIYVTRYVNWSFTNNPICESSVQGPRDICPPKSFEPLADKLLISHGDTFFQEESGRFGLRQDGKGLGVLCADFDNDQDLDVYVANDTTVNFLYLNQSDNSFSEVGLRHGVAVDEKGLPNGSMGIGAFDYDGNGWLDLWVTNYEREAFAVYHNSGDALFTHLSRKLGTTVLGGSFVGFGTDIGDLDNNGSPEIVVANGHVIYHPTAAPRRQTPILMTMVDGRFRRENFSEDTYLGSTHEGRGLAVGDLNGDGKKDIVISHINEPVSILINASTVNERSLQLRLIGTNTNRDAIGTRVVIRQGKQENTFQIIGGGSYLSRSDRTIVCGLRENESEREVQVYWPGHRSPQKITIDAKSLKWTIVEPSRSE